MMTPQPVVAIDGPAASGKSSVSKSLALHLGFAYVNTGAMYRAITWKTLQQKLDPTDTVTVTSLIKTLQITCEIREKEMAMEIDGENPLPFLREPEVNQHVSAVSAVPEVRRVLLQLQRGLAQSQPLVVEGRDIGSVVFPETPYKFYLDADPSVRANRRSQQGEQDKILIRDKQDSSRRSAPLAMARGAIRIDSSHLTLEQVVSTILGELRQLGLKRSS